MKKVFFAMTLLAAVAAAPAFAQTATVRANVPHEFVVNGYNLPAGEYEVAETFGSNAVHVRSIDRKETVILLAQDGTVTNGDSSMVFRVADGKYYLSAYVRGGLTKELAAKDVPAGATLASIKASLVKR